jgi:hypothetical protein
MVASILVDALSPVTERGLSQARARLLRDPSFQFSFDSPPGPPPAPSWLRWIGKLVSWIVPYASWLLWAVLIVGVLIILGLIGREIIAKRGGRRKPRANTGPVLSDWHPDKARARVLLSDADKLASEGRFAEAARLLLHRSIEEIEDRRPTLVATAYTSRDIAALDRLPDPARRAFSRIARHVECSLFGDQPMDADAFGDCRKAYSDFAFPETWVRP